MKPSLEIPDGDHAFLTVVAPFVLDESCGFKIEVNSMVERKPTFQNIPNILCGVERNFHFHIVCTIK